MKNKLTVDSCPDACGYLTIRYADGTEHGNTETQPVATVYENQGTANLFATAPELLATLQILRTQCQNARRYIDLSNNEGFAAYNATAQALQAADTAIFRALNGISETSVSGT